METSPSSLYFWILVVSTFTEVSSFLGSTAWKGLVPSLVSETMEAKDDQRLLLMIKDLFMGPLKGEPTTLLVSKELENKTRGIDVVLKGILEPVNLVRLPKIPAMEVEKEMVSNTTGSRAILRFAEYFDEFQGNGIRLQPGGVVVLMTSEDSMDLLELFLHPPKHWSSKAIVVISLSPSCWQENFLELPLMQITPSAALICPSIPQGHSKVLPYRGHDFKVWTWLPYVSSQKLVDLGTWKRDRFRKWNHLFVDRFKDMSEKTVKILGINIDRPFYYSRANGEHAGQTYQIVDALGKWLNYKLNVSGSVTVSYNLIEELVSLGENDLMFNLANPTLERSERFQLTVPYAYEGFGLMLEIPPPLPRWQNIIYPYSMEVWIWTIASLFATSVTFHILYYRKEKSFMTNTITISQSLLSNPLAVVPEGWVVKCFLLVWWIASWMLNLSYTCNLIAILTVPAFPTRIQTAYELAESNYRLCMVDYGEFVPEALRTSRQETLFALGAKLDMVPQVDYLPEMGEEECVDRVLKGTHSHIEAYPYAATLYSMWDLDPKVYALHEHLYQSYVVLLIYKHAPWKYKFDIGIENLREGGLLQKWYQDGMDEFKGAVADDGSRIVLTPLSLSHLQGSFYLLGCGLFMALLLVMVEILFPPRK